MPTTGMLHYDDVCKHGHGNSRVHDSTKSCHTTLMRNLRVLTGTEYLQVQHTMEILVRIDMSEVTDEHRGIDLEFFKTPRVGPQHGKHLWQSRHQVGASAESSSN